MAPRQSAPARKAAKAKTKPAAKAKPAAKTKAKHTAKAKAKAKLTVKAKPAAAPRGSTIYHGPLPPEPKFGRFRDLFVNIATGELIYKDRGGWVVILNTRPAASAPPAQPATPPASESFDFG